MQVKCPLQRKPDDEPAKEDEAAKKQKVVEEGGGDAATKVNGKVNGTKTSPEKAMVILRSDKPVQYI